MAIDSTNGRRVGAAPDVDILSRRFFGAVLLEADLDGVEPRRRSDRTLAVVLEGAGSLWVFRAESALPAAPGSVRVPVVGSGRWLRVLPAVAGPPGDPGPPGPQGPRGAPGASVISLPLGASRDYDATEGFQPGSWADQAGTGDALNANPAKQPRPGYGPTVRFAVYFDGSENRWLADDEAASDPEYTICLAFNYDGSQAASAAAVYSNRPWGAPVGGTRTLLGLASDFRLLVYQDDVLPSPALTVPHEPPIPIHTPTVVSLVVRGSRRYLYRDGVFLTADDAVSAQANLETKRAVFLGGEDTGAQFGGFLYHAAYFGAALSKIQRRAAEMALMVPLGLSLPDFVIYADGDSRVQAIAPGNSTLIAHTVSALDGLGAPARRIINVARSGIQVSTMAANVPYLVAPGFLSCARCFAFLGSAHNSIKNVGLSDVDVMDEIAAYVAAARNAGFRVLVATTPESPALAPFTVKLASVNAWVRTTYGADVVDIAAIVGLTYADADHEDDPGYALGGAVLASVLAPLLV